MSNTARLDLLGTSGGTATGNSMAWPGGDGSFLVDCAGFNGATVALQVQLPNSSWANVGSNTTLTANGIGNFSLPPCNLRCAITVAVPSSNAFAAAVRINP